MLKTMWAVTATAIAAALGILHFANPYPLVQVPDRGHRLYFVPENQRETVLAVLALAGVSPFGTFNAGVKQTLMRDGFTVLASGPVSAKAALSLPVDDPRATAEQAHVILETNGVRSAVEQPDPQLAGKLVVVHMLDIGWDLAFRLPGYEMPAPKWE